ncbi:Chromate transporter [Pyrenophora tritici-repentis]|nr:Chromate transporter [Pyrenophora tritici-repentis]
MSSNGSYSGYYAQNKGAYTSRPTTSSTSYSATSSRSLNTNSGTSSRGKCFSQPPVVHNGGGKLNDPNTSTSYQELFALNQALPGPASTKMCFCIALLHAGIFPATLAFTLWSLPGALTMFGLALGVHNLPSRLPAIVYALLSGLNASTIMRPEAAAVKRRTQAGVSNMESEREDTTAVAATPARTTQTVNRVHASNEPTISPVPDTTTHNISVKLGLSLIAGFFTSFIIIMVIRATLTNTRPFNLFSNMYLAGTIIFGGGPVVIPLLRSYVVDPGWVSPRDFLLGLAIIQAMPGPNFNFAVYLGALAVSSTSTPTIIGAILGFIGIFFPGMVLAVGVQSVWQVMRTKRIDSPSGSKNISYWHIVAPRFGLDDRESD